MGLHFISISNNMMAPVYSLYYCPIGNKLIRKFSLSAIPGCWPRWYQGSQSKKAYCSRVIITFPFSIEFHYFIRPLCYLFWPFNVFGSKFNPFRLVLLVFYYHAEIVWHIFYVFQLLQFQDMERLHIQKGSSLCSTKKEIC